MFLTFFCDVLKLYTMVFDSTKLTKS